jgi:hypothetical protein
MVLTLVSGDQRRSERSGNSHDINVVCCECVSLDSIERFFSRRDDIVLEGLEKSIIECCLRSASDTQPSPECVMFYFFCLLSVWSSYAETLCSRAAFTALCVMSYTGRAESVERSGKMIEASRHYKRL